jgi:hypothetical protein
MSKIEATPGEGVSSPKEEVKYEFNLPEGQIDVFDAFVYAEFTVKGWGGADDNFRRDNVGAWGLNPIEDEGDCPCPHRDLLVMATNWLVKDADGSSMVRITEWEEWNKKDLKWDNYNVSMELIVPRTVKRWLDIEQGVATCCTCALNYRDLTGFFPTPKRVE